MVSSSAGGFSAEEEITVKKSPKAEFKFTETNGLLDLENTTLDYDFAEWTFPGIKTEELNPSFEMLYSSDYTVSLKVRNAEGCESEESKEIHYVVDHHIFAPDAFTPDGDGVNDEFQIKYEPKEGYKYTLQIFNSSGKKLFETSEMGIGWDGGNAISNSRRNYEKYTWRLIIQDPRGKKEVKESIFQILKH
jgi:gliding motility-associated-like protein